MTWKPLTAALALICLPAFAEESAPEPAPSENPYRHLDWISPAEIAAMAPEARPRHTGMCDGLYRTPPLTATNLRNERVAASADRFDTLPDGTSVLTGAVEIHQGSRELFSDEVLLNRHTRAAALSGNVTIRQPGMLILGDHASINLNEKSIDVANTEYVIHDIHAHGTAARIYNPSSRVLVLDQSTYTTCEPDDNAWRITARNIRLDQDTGWGEVRGATIEVADIPLLYLPWWAFPIDDRRQSGFLFPVLGSSDNGFEVSTPYYLNLAPNYDLTLTPRILTDRGEMLEGQFRYLGANWRGAFGLGYLPNDRVYNDDRYLLRWEHQGQKDDWHSFVNYTRVGDSNHFIDLDTTLNAFRQTHLIQEAGLRYWNSDWRGLVQFQQFQTIDELIADEDLPYRSLPKLQIERYLSSPARRAEFSALAEYTYFDHPVDDISGPTSAHRSRLIPTWTMNQRRAWGYLTETLSVEHRYYDLQEAAVGDNTRSLTTPTLSVDSGLFFDKPVQVNAVNYLQTLEPRLFYLYTPFREQGTLPIFDTAKTSFSFEQLFRRNRYTGGDRVSDANQISLGLTSRLINQSSGEEKFSVGIGQAFYFRDRDVQLSAIDAAETTDVSPLVTRFRWAVNDQWFWRAETQWDAQENNLDSMVTGISYRATDQSLVNLSYNYYDDGAITADPLAEKIRQTDFSFAWSVSQHWGLLGRWGYDLEQRRSFDNIVGIEYESCCWRVRLVNRRYLEESNDESNLVEPSQGVFVQFELKGLGGLGGAVDTMLAETIPGYDRREANRPAPFAQTTVEE